MNIKDKAFDTEKLSETLHGDALKSGVWTATAQACRFGINVIGIVILARLISPYDYGLMAMILPLTLFLIVLKDSGCILAVIQNEHVTHNEASNLFWLNMGISLLFFLIMWGCAPIIAIFYGYESLTPICRSIGTLFIFSGFGTIHQGALRRRMKFKYLAIVEVSSLCAGVIFGTLIAVFTRNIWALIAYQWTTNLLVSIGYWWGAKWTPGLPNSSSIKSLLAFAIPMSGANICNLIRLQAPLIIIGKLLGAVPLASYQKGYELLVFPIQKMMPPLGSVVVPTISRLQNDPTESLKIINYIIRIIIILAFPLSLICVSSAPEVVEIILGAQWGHAAPVIACLGCVGLTQISTSAPNWYLMGLGNGKALFHYSVINACLVLLSVIIGIPWGIIGVAISFAAIDITLRTPLLYLFAVKQTPLSWEDLLRPMLWPAVLFTTLLPTLYLLRQAITPYPISMILLINSSIILLIWGTVIFYSPSMKECVTTLLQQCKYYMQKERLR